MTVPLATQRRRRAAERVMARAGAGGTISLRKIGTLDPGTDLIVDGTQAIASVTLAIEATGGVLNGHAALGMKVTVAGDAQVYEATTRKRAAANKVVLDIKPALVLEATDGAVITVTQQYGEFAYTRYSPAQHQETEPADTHRQQQRLFLGAHTQSVAPETGDMLMGSPVLYVHDSEIGDADMYYIVIAGNQSPDIKRRSTSV